MAHCQRQFLASRQNVAGNSRLNTSEQITEDAKRRPCRAPANSVAQCTAANVRTKKQARARTFGRSSCCAKVRVAEVRHRRSSSRSQHGFNATSARNTGTSKVKWATGGCDNSLRRRNLKGNLLEANPKHILLIPSFQSSALLKKKKKFCGGLKGFKSGFANTE